MNCFYHPTTIAVGICKSCSKALCTACAVDLGRGLACVDKCEEDVRNVIKLIDQNVDLMGASRKLVGSARTTYFASGIFQISFGLLLLTVGVAVGRFSDLYGGLFFIVMAFLFLIYGGFYLRRGFSIPSKKPNPK